MATSVNILSAGTGLLTRSTMDLYSILQYVLSVAIVTVMVKRFGGTKPVSIKLPATTS